MENEYKSIFFDTKEFCEYSGFFIRTYVMENDTNLTKDAQQLKYALIEALRDYRKPFEASNARLRECLKGLGDLIMYKGINSALKAIDEALKEGNQ